MVRGVNGGGIWGGIAGIRGIKGGIRERLTPGPLTLLSLSLRIRSLSLRALSLREFLGQVVHKEFEQSLNSKGWIFHSILCKVSTSIYRERRKGKGHLGELRDRRGRGI